MITTLYEPFRHWSEGGSVFILSDTHFDDADCKLMDPAGLRQKSALSKVQEFDYDRYIWQIQFCLCNIAHSEIEYSTTIDYVRRKVTDCKTNTNTHTTDKRVYDLEDDESFDELLSISEIAKLHEFEELSEQELKGRTCGYRDGWRLKYSYFTHEAPPRIDGSLGTVYDDSPFEKIFEWIIERAPYDIYGL